jgi:AAA+ superfamily predicted ATPase
VLHGNVHDLFPCGDDGKDLVSLTEFLGEYLFGRWDVVLKHNLSRGLQALAGRDAERHQEMMRHLTGLFGHYRNWSRKPDDILLTLDQMIDRYLLEEDPSQRKRLAVVFDYGQYLVPPGEPVQISGSIASRVVRFLDWARNPYIRRVNMAFCLVCENLSEVNDRLVQSPYVSAVEVPMPDRESRQRFVTARLSSSDRDQQQGGLTAEELVSNSNGLSLLSLEQLLALAGGARGVSGDQFRSLKKTAIERQCGGFLEFVEPRHTLDLVVGHEAAVGRLRQDAGLISAGHSDAAPMGYLVCGPVGTGKTFLAECYAGSIGIPCVKLKNFRSKYVGETEGNLQRVLTVLRSLGPVIVIIDEADAALGDRNQSGDSGTSGRIFSMIAQQMGDTRYRGKIIWMLLTCRPDLLPIDLKRQGRAEVHIPLFYPDNEAEIRSMFQVMGRKNDVGIDPQKIVLDERHRELSGADIESVVLAARRMALVDSRSEVSPEDLDQALREFIPSAQGLEKEMQEVAAVLECTQMDFLNADWKAALESDGGRSQLQQQLTKMRNLVEQL